MDVITTFSSLHPAQQVFGSCLHLHLLCQRSKLIYCILFYTVFDCFVFDDFFQSVLCLAVGLFSLKLRLCHIISHLGIREHRFPHICDVIFCLALRGIFCRIADRLCFVLRCSDVLTRIIYIARDRYNNSQSCDD